MGEDANVDTTETEGEIKVSAHVLVQLGEELVTDVEQAILECVKNAYDADSKGCSIKIDTQRTGKLVQRGTPAKLGRYTEATENVVVTLKDENGGVLKLPLKKPQNGEPEDRIFRHLEWVGSVVVEDHGDGLTYEQLQGSWLVISGSGKRTSSGKKVKTKHYERTPLGDKGVGRLGSMKLGDILQIQSAVSPTSPIGSAAFRWADCDIAGTVDQIPVLLSQQPNTAKFKGTRVSVLGLKNIEQWRGSRRAIEITRSLARLISPFEAQSTFPVSVEVDGHRQTLVAMTDTLLNRAVVQFDFSWIADPKTKEMSLKCSARFRERLFRPTGGTARQKHKTARTFENDDGAAFLEWLEKSGKLRRYDIKTDRQDGWFLELKQSIAWKSILPVDDENPIEDPGPLKGAWYFFFLKEVSREADEGEGNLDTEAAAGLGIDGSLVKDMAGISILRDGFRVRSPGDWLNVSSGMTSGSTYGLRFDNTVGYFALTGEHNFRLVEKSDREGFVQNAALRGFMAIAKACNKFADDALEAARRGQDDYVKYVERTEVNEAPKSTERSFELVQKSVDAVVRVQQEANDVREALEIGIASVAEQLKAHGVSQGETSKALGGFKSALQRVSQTAKNLEVPTHAAAAVQVIRNEIADSKEQMLSLYESAAVGLSARGMAHDLRTYIVEIRKRASAIELLTKDGKATSEATLPHLRALRAACSSIAASAALIDPLLPRTRAVKESIELSSFLSEYFENRQSALGSEGIEYKLRKPTSPTSVRINRGRLLAVLDNLVRNSVYWLRRGQKVLKIARTPTIHVEIKSNGFVIWDTGPGVDPAYEDNLFEIFVSAKPAADRGQGLGLFIVSQLLSADGCSLSLASERNEEGNRFKFAVNLASVVEGGKK
jgi:signal transduction histidine kinase